MDFRHIFVMFDMKRHNIRLIVAHAAKHHSVTIYKTAYNSSLVGYN